MATYVFYPASLQDGSASRLQSSGSTWSGLVTGVGTSYSDSGTTFIGMRTQSDALDTDEWDQIERGILIFDTSSILDTDIVDSGTLTLTLDSKINEFVSWNPLIGIYPYTGSITISNNSYQAVGSTSEMTSVKALSSLSAGASTTYTLSDTAGRGINNVSITGYTKYSIRTTNDANNLSPTWESDKDVRAIFRSTDYTGTTSDPTLTIETIAGSSLNRFVNVSDVFKPVTARKVNVEDSWKPVVARWRNAGGIWKRVF